MEMVRAESGIQQERRKRPSDMLDRCALVGLTRGSCPPSLQVPAFDAGGQHEQALADVGRLELVGRKFRQESLAQRIPYTKVAREIVPYTVHDVPEAFVWEALLDELSVLGNFMEAERKPDTPQASLPGAPTMNEVHQARDDEVRVAILLDHRSPRMLTPISFRVRAGSRLTGRSRPPGLLLPLPFLDRASWFDAPERFVDAGCGRR